MSATEQDRERARAWIERNVPEAPKGWVADNSPFTRGIVKKDAVDLLAREFAADRERIAALERERDAALAHAARLREALAMVRVMREALEQIEAMATIESVQQRDVARAALAECERLAKESQP